MDRIHAFEFNELQQTPRFLRESLVEILGNGLRWGKIYDPAVPFFLDFLRKTNATTCLDLCSGSGEPVSILLEGIARAGSDPPQFSISDLLPNRAAMRRVAQRHRPHIKVIGQSVNALDVPPALDCQARSIISAFHHFSPEMGAEILADCVQKNKPIFILEAFIRDVKRFLALLPHFALPLVLNPFISSRDRMLKYFFSFVIPLIPFIGIWDGVVSVYRIHTEADLRAMVHPFGQNFDWNYEELPAFPGGRIVIFSGIPRLER